MSRVIEYTGNQNLRAGNLFIKFGSEWCGPCRMAKPTIDDLSEEFKNITFLDVNVDYFELLASDYGIKTIPSIVLVKNGDVVNVIKGFDNIQYRKALNELTKDINGIHK